VDEGAAHVRPAKPNGASDARRQADRLERRADLLRADLGALVDELGARGRRLARALRRPSTIVVAVAGLAAVVTLAALAWRRARRA
jgi:hypothetical protein